MPNYYTDDRSISANQNILDQLKRQEAIRDAGYRRELSQTRPGTNYYYASHYGSDLPLNRQVYAKRNLDIAAAQDERFNQIAWRRDMPGAVMPKGYGYGDTGYGRGNLLASYKGGYTGNPNDALPAGTSPYNPAPARQAVDAAVKGNAALNSPGSKTVVSDDGYMTTYYGDGSMARTKVPSGANIQRTENGHTVINFPNGLNRVVSSAGDTFDYTHPPIAQSIADHTNPVIPAEQPIAAPALKSSYDLTLSPYQAPTTPPAVSSNPLTNYDVGPAAANTGPVAATQVPNQNIFGSRVGDASRNALNALGSVGTAANTVYNVLSSYKRPAEAY